MYGSYLVIFEHTIIFPTHIISFHRNQIFFNEFNVERLPGYPQNNGDDAIIKFYVDYPSDLQKGSLPKAILASIVSSELQKFQNLTGLSIVLDTPATPEVPEEATVIQEANAVVLQILGFSEAQV